MASDSTDREALEATYLERLPLLRRTAKALCEEVVVHLDGIHRIDQIRFRVKDSASFLDKVLERKIEPPYTAPLLEVEDQIAGRINVFFLDDVEAVQARLATLFGAVEVSERRPERVTEFDYEGFHGIYNLPPQCKPAGWEARDDLPATFELQVRTLFQHAWAEPQHDIAYKPQVELLFDERREVAWVAASAWGADHAFNRLAAAIAARADRPGASDN